MLRRTSSRLTAVPRGIPGAENLRPRSLRHVFPLCGGSSDDPDVVTLSARIVAVILERPTCLTCLAPKVGAPSRNVLRAIESIGQTVNVRIAQGERCRACGSTVSPTYSLPR